ncbi:MAG: hypothetical protein HEEMFOPI_01056 [Holosporales bacterium]
MIIQDFKNSRLSAADHITAKVYRKLRYNFLRSKSIGNSLRYSNIERLYHVKGMSTDTLEYPELEIFWKKMEHYFKADELPVLKIMDLLTGFSHLETALDIKLAKSALKKFRNILKYVDIYTLFEKTSKSIKRDAS